jgi:hypothetical protein
MMILLLNSQYFDLHYRWTDDEVNKRNCIGQSISHEDLFAYP